MSYRGQTEVMFGPFFVRKAIGGKSSRNTQVALYRHQTFITRIGKHNKENISQNFKIQNLPNLEIFKVKIEIFPKISKVRTLFKKIVR